MHRLTGGRSVAERTDSAMGVELSLPRFSIIGFRRKIKKRNPATKEDIGMITWSNSSVFVLQQNREEKLKFIAKMQEYAK